MEVDHNCLVLGEEPVDNFRYLDSEIGFGDMDLFGTLVMDLGSSWHHFGILKLGLDIWGAVLYSSVAHWNN